MPPDPSDTRRWVDLGEEQASIVVRASAESFDAFYASRWNATARLAFMVVGASGAAEEVTQDAFVRVHGRWDSLDSPDAFLRTVTMNLCRSHLRRRKVEQRHSPDARQVSVAPPELDETWLAVLRLPFRQRAVLALRYYADLPEEEIALLLGCRIGTVKSARHRALAALRKELS